MDATRKRGGHTNTNTPQPVSVIDVTTPSAIKSKRRRPQSNSKVIIGVGIMVIIIVFLVLFSSNEAGAEKLQSNEAKAPACTWIDVGAGCGTDFTTATLRRDDDVRDLDECLSKCVDTTTCSRVAYGWKDVPTRCVLLADSSTQLEALTESCGGLGGATGVHTFQYVRPVQFVGCWESEEIHGFGFAIMLSHEEDADMVVVDDFFDDCVVQCQTALARWMVIYDNKECRCGLHNKKVKKPSSTQHPCNGKHKMYDVLPPGHDEVMEWDESVTCSVVPNTRGMKASSPDGYEPHGPTGTAGDASFAIDGNWETYWDQEDDVAGPHILQLSDDKGREFAGYSLEAYAFDNFAPRDWTVECDGATVDTADDTVMYDKAASVMRCLPAKYTCKVVKLIITKWYGLSPAIREFEIYPSE